MMRLAGIDGCKGGWVVVHAKDGALASAEVSVVTSLTALREIGIACAVIDIPIGLTEGAIRREADTCAKAFLGAKAASVFIAPARATLGAETHQEAVRVNKDETGKGISIQAFAICRKIAEVDALMQLAERPPLIEGHPEVSFALAEGAPILAPKRRAEGKRLRHEALARLGFCDTHGLVAAARAAARACGCRLGTDDVLDAAILLWSAGRVGARHRTFPAHPGCDARGLTMAIHA